MRTVQLDHQTDFDGWRAAARALRLAGIAPEQVSWRVGEGAGLFAGEPPPEAAPGEGFSAPRAFVDLARDVICHRSPARFGLLYSLLWRLKDEPALLGLVTDQQVAQAVSMQRQVGQAEHKMHAFVRFRRADDPDDPATPEAYVAWFEPAHFVARRGAVFFVRRMANLRFSILTPDLSAHWDGTELSFTPGVDKSQAPPPDALEDWWRAYYASVFNPARLNPALMTGHMPRRYWRNLPEAEVIPALVQQAAARSEAMVQASPTVPSERARRRTDRAKATEPQARREALAETEIVPAKLEDIAAAVQACRRCDLWKDATQGVPGEGPRHAPLMFVGEQPGDQEDLAGHPFVGPAGEMLNRALAEAGVPREDAYVTNAVKHFKHELKGKRRLHRTPDRGEVAACRWWLDNERRLVRPKVVVALGATAASAVLGRPVAVMKERGPAGELDGGGTAFVTVHPSMLLRIPDRMAKAAAYADFVRDLGQAYALVQAA